MNMMNDLPEQTAAKARMAVGNGQRILRAGVLCGERDKKESLAENETSWK